MYELKVTVTKVMGACTADPPMKPGDYFMVRDGDIRIPEGGYICMWALQSILPLITPKEREIAEPQDQDWMWRVHHAQCPDPKGRVIFKIDRAGRVEKGAGEQSSEPVKRVDGGRGHSGGLRDLRVVVKEVQGKCTSGMQPGDRFFLRSGRLYISPDHHLSLIHI